MQWYEPYLHGLNQLFPVIELYNDGFVVRGELDENYEYQYVISVHRYTESDNDDNEWFEIEINKADFARPFTFQNAHSTIKAICILKEAFDEIIELKGNQHEPI